MYCRDCNHRFEVKETKKASGVCQNCGAAFWDRYIVNGLREISCIKCHSITDLFNKKDGTLTDASGVK